MGRTRIKICGVRDAETALAAAECGADAVGLVFVESSPRFIEPDQAWEVACALPPMITRIGVFADAPPERFFAVKERCPFDYGQLHGGESEEVVRACGPWIIKAVRYEAATIESELARWSAVAEIDALLIDGGAGDGREIDWDALARVKHLCHHPIILAGGLTPRNVGQAIRAVRPFAVDVSSGVERDRGVKDARLIAAFCEAVRGVDG